MRAKNDIEGKALGIFFCNPDFTTKTGLGFENADFNDARGGANFLSNGAFQISAKGGIGGGLTDGHFAENADETILFRGGSVLIRTANEIEIAIEGVGGGFERSAFTGGREEQ